MILACQSKFFEGFFRRESKEMVMLDFKENLGIMRTIVDVGRGGSLWWSQYAIVGVPLDRDKEIILLEHEMFIQNL